MRPFRACVSMMPMSLTCDHCSSSGRTSCARPPVFASERKNVCQTTHLFVPHAHARLSTHAEHLRTVGPLRLHTHTHNLAITRMPRDSPTTGDRGARGKDVGRLTALHLAPAPSAAPAHGRRPAALHATAAGRPPAPSLRLGRRARAPRRRAPRARGGLEAGGRGDLLERGSSAPACTWRSRGA